MSKKNKQCPECRAYTVDLTKEVEIIVKKRQGTIQAETGVRLSIEQIINKIIKESHEKIL